MFFSSPDKFRQWLEKNHNRANELLVGFHKKDSGKKSITYPEALDEALCFGWIDGVRKSLDETSYTIHFTPRKPKSIRSNVNIRHVEWLKKEGYMVELKAYALRDPKRTGIYAFETGRKNFTGLSQEVPRQQTRLEVLPNRATVISQNVHLSAKKEETRLRRLEQLIESSEKGERRGALEASPKER